MNHPYTIEELFRDGRLIQAVVKYAGQYAVWEHQQLGFPIVTNIDGKVVWIPPEEINVTKPIPPDPADYPIVREPHSS